MNQPAGVAGEVSGVRKLMTEWRSWWLRSLRTRDPDTWYQNTDSLDWNL